MSKLRGRVLPVLLAATVVVGGANLAAYAANGKPVLLGNTNVASKTTIIKNNKGTALKIKSKSGVAPLKVSNTTKVTKLNADLVDGLDGPSLQNKTYTYNLTGTAASQWRSSGSRCPGCRPGSTSPAQRQCLGHRRAHLLRVPLRQWRALHQRQDRQSRRTQRRVLQQCQWLPRHHRPDLHVHVPE